LRERLGFAAAASEDYQTVAGLAMSLLDRLPVIGDQLEHADWRLTVTEVKDRRVSKVLLVPLTV
jgi:CBS domain containing-hemolysin-like protein